MADDKQSGNWGSSFIVVAFAAVSALYVAWQRPPLISTRPTDPQYHAYKVNAPQDVDARLWQDPFNAVTQDLQQRDAAGPPNDDHLITEFAPDANTLALGVTLPGAPYPEAAETRRRLRYAVLAALHTEGYARVDEKHIGYFRIPETTSQGRQKNNHRPNQSRRSTRQQRARRAAFRLRMTGNRKRHQMPTQRVEEPKATESALMARTRMLHHFRKSSRTSSSKTPLVGFRRADGAEPRHCALARRRFPDH